MKPTLKLILALAVFCFATHSLTAQESTTTVQKTFTQGQYNAIEKVKAAVASGNQDSIKAALAEQIAAYPELFTEILEAAIIAAAPTFNSPFPSQTLKTIVRQVALFAPDRINIINGIVLKTMRSLGGDTANTSSQITELKLIAEQAIINNRGAGDGKETAITSVSQTGQISPP